MPKILYVEIEGEEIPMTPEDLQERATTDLNWASRIGNIEDASGQVHGLTWSVSIDQID